MLQVYKEYSWQIVEFRRRFLHSPTYFNMSWRLDFEIARRNIREINLPTYMIRFDLLSDNGSVYSKENNNDNCDGDSDNHINSDNNNNNNNNNSNKNKNDNNETRNNMKQGGICEDPKSQENKIFSYSVREKIKMKESLSVIHLQCDFANLKKMETEIKLALKSCKITNSQTTMEYVT